MLDEDFSKLQMDFISTKPPELYKTGSIASLEGKMSCLFAAETHCSAALKTDYQRLFSIHYYFDEGNQRYYEDYELYLNRYGYGINYTQRKKYLYGTYQKHEYRL